MSYMHLLVISVYLVNGIDISAGNLCTTSVRSSLGTKDFLDRIFLKYGTLENSNYTILDRTHIRKLMGSVSLGSVIVKCRRDDLNCLSDKFANHNIYKVGDARFRRSTTISEKEEKEMAGERKRIKEHERLWKKHVRNCLKTEALLSRHGINESDGINKGDFIRICPALFEQIDSKVCIHYHKKIRKHKHYQDIPSPSQVWGYGFLSITLISILSLAVIGMVPCLKKSFYSVVMAFLVALAVGTLSGDAMLHLIPHAFVEGANRATNITISKDMKLKQHYSQVWRALFVLLGIYVFFLVEQIMKLKAICRGGEVGGGHGHSHGDNKGKSHRLKAEKDSPVLQLQDADTSSHSKDIDGSQINMLEVPYKSHSSSLSGQSDLGDDTFHSDDRHHHQHHGEKNITKESNISSVAWMVVVGDGFHNFSDGLAVGAAFSASLSSGVSTAIAVFCHELPHELGDFAILIKSGMTIKQAFVYNVVSAVLAYVGLTVGILAGGNELGRHFILSITAGLFLYVSLADMLPELTHQDIPNRSIFATFTFQHLGLLSGIGLMLFISLYEHMM